MLMHDHSYGESERPQDSFLTSRTALVDGGCERRLYQGPPEEFQLAIGCNVNPRQTIDRD